MLAYRNSQEATKQRIKEAKKQSPSRSLGLARPAVAISPYKEL